MKTPWRWFLDLVASWSGAKAIADQRRESEERSKAAAARFEKKHTDMMEQTMETTGNTNG